jgi:hypothetical protein
MITIERHINFDNWINVKLYRKLVDQFTCRNQAIVVAKELSRKHKVKIVDLDSGPKHWRNNAG